MIVLYLLIIVKSTGLGYGSVEIGREMFKEKRLSYSIFVSLFYIVAYKHVCISKGKLLLKKNSVHFKIFKIKKIVIPINTFF